MQPKFDIGLFVRNINEEQEMMIITVVNESNVLVNASLPHGLNNKYKCAWIKDQKVFLKIFDESELYLAPATIG